MGVRNVNWGARNKGKWPCCQGCGTTVIRHEGGGLCTACYRDVQTQTKKYKARVRVSRQRYREKMGIDVYRARMRDYQKKYYLRNKKKIDARNRKWMKKYYKERHEGNSLWQELVTQEKMEKKVKR